MCVGWHWPRVALAARQPVLCGRTCFGQPFLHDPPADQQPVSPCRCLSADTGDRYTASMLENPYQSPVAPPTPRARSLLLLLPRSSSWASIACSLGMFVSYHTRDWCAWHVRTAMAQGDNEFRTWLQLAKGLSTVTEVLLVGAAILAIPAMVDTRNFRVLVCIILLAVVLANAVISG